MDAGVEGLSHRLLPTPKKRQGLRNFPEALCRPEIFSPGPERITPGSVRQVSIAAVADIQLTDRIPAPRIAGI